MLYTDRASMQWGLDFKRVFTAVMDHIKVGPEVAYVVNEKRDDARSFAADNDNVQYVVSTWGGRDYVIIQ